MRPFVLIICALLLSCNPTVDGGGGGHPAAPQAPPARPAEVDPQNHDPAPEIVIEARRVIAIGDLHGDLEATHLALRLGGLIDANGGWSGGDTVLVQLGDILSRGDDERRILDLLARLAEEARLVGGEVIVLIGNHELMAAQGDFRYVTPGALAAWAELADPSAPCPATLPPAACGRALAFAPGGPMARRLATFPMVAQVDGSLFVHGGLLPEHLDAGIDALNDQARAFFSGAVSEPGPALAGPRSPLWVRALGEEPPDCAAVAQTLAMTGARRLVVGHTLQANGIQPACAGTLWRIETGLSAVYGRKVQVLEVRGDLVRVLP